MKGKEISLGAVVGAPLRAAVEAQASAAQASVDFIRQMAFEPGGEGATASDSGRVRMLVFYFDRPRRGGGTELVRLEVPLLTVVPLPYLRLEEMTVDFKVNVAASTEQEGDAGQDYLSPGSRLQLAANLSSKKDSQSTRSSRYAVETTMDFHLRVAQDDLPSGMQHLMSVLSEAIQVQPVPPAAPALDDASPP
jgi:hypothetical protein